MLNLRKLVLEENFEQLQLAFKKNLSSINQHFGCENTPLSLAAHFNKKKLVLFLLENGADVNLANADRLAYTPIEVAAREGHSEIVQLLINDGAYIDKGNSINGSALIGACIAGHEKIVKQLIKAGANVNHLMNGGNSALHYLCQYAKQHASVQSFEIIDGEEKEVPNNRYKIYCSIVNTLIKNGIDVNAINQYGKTPLILACETNAPEFVSFLLKSNVVVNFRNAKGYTAIHGACDFGNLDCCKLLIKGGADINATDQDGFTPILGAVMADNFGLAKLLLANGAFTNISAKVNYKNVIIGDTPISLAKRTGNPLILKLLENG